MHSAKLHKEVKQLAYYAYHFNNKKAIYEINHFLIPQLVRLDLETMSLEEKEVMEEDFLVLLEQEFPGEICNRALRDIFLEKRQKQLKQAIMKLVPLRPEMEFPEALAMKRHFVLHVGPTNSGKTFQALERLKRAKKGIYLGPLRLLALEVYEKMRENNVACTMLTGQECLEMEGSAIQASTIEMLNVDEAYEVAVIDEAQMIEDEIRGYSWTRAILGILAEEIHICMSPAAEPVITHLISLCNDEYEIHRYERKTQLVFEDKSFSFPQDVQEGDALVVFSKKAVLDVAGRLEEQGIESSVIYGSLPPEIRRRQMRLFTSGETKVVVSTDAIGMGLNLPVKRIIFMQTEKFDGQGVRKLLPPEVKQIAGRAGRFGIYDTGYINAMGDGAASFIRQQFYQEDEMIEKVNLGFPQVLLGMDGALDEILQLWHEEEAKAPFHKISIEDMLLLYRAAYRKKEWIPGFSDKYLLYRMITCPIDVKDRDVLGLWLSYCENYMADVSLEKPRLHGRLQGLAKYETYYKKLDLYYQFSVRMGKVLDNEWLEGEREKTQTIIMQLLSKDKNLFISRCKYCGRVLPVEATHGVCRRCHSMRYY